MRTIVDMYFDINSILKGRFYLECRCGDRFGFIRPGFQMQYMSVRILPAHHTGLFRAFIKKD